MTSKLLSHLRGLIRRGRAGYMLVALLVSPTPAQPQQGGGTSQAAVSSGADAHPATSSAQTPSDGTALGGVGAGTFRLMSDGSVGAAALAGDRGRPSGLLPGCFAAIWTHESTRTVVRVLAGRSAYGLPAVKRIQSETLSPQMRFVASDPALPVSVSLLAFSPLIPFSLKDSSYPAAAFILRLHNPLPVSVEVSVALSWESMLGPGGDGGGHEIEDRSGVGAAVLPSSEGYFGVRFTQPHPAVKAGGSADPAGEMELLANPQSPQAAVTTAIWDAQSARPEWWERFTQTGDVGGGANVGGAHPAAVMAIHLTLKPNEYADIPYAVSWYLPHSAQSDGRDVGRYYETLFTSADDAARRLLTDWLGLYSLTEEWQERLTFSNLPKWLVHDLISATEPLIADSLIARDGRFLFVSNGAGADPVSSGMSLPKARLAANSLLLAFFPRLAERSLTDRAGEIMGTADPLNLLPPPAAAPPAAPLPQESTDQEMEEDSVFILELAQYALWIGDGELLRSHYPAAQKVLHRLLQTSSEGAAPMAAPIRTGALTLRLAALRAGRRLAARIGDGALAQACDATATQSAAQIEAQRWNGRCYSEGAAAALTSPTMECEQDQLLGQWAADEIGLGLLLPSAHLETTLHTLSASQGGGPAGAPPAVSTPVAPSDLWLSIVIPALWGGLPSEAVGMLERAGKAGNEAGRLPEAGRLERSAPWNALYALAGVQIDLDAEQMALLPNPPGTWRSLNCPIFAPTFWGELEYKPTARGGMLALRVVRLLNFSKEGIGKGAPARGADLTLRTLKTPGPPVRLGDGAPSFAVYISVGRRLIGAKSVLGKDGVLTHTFDTPLQLTAGDRLVIDVH